VLITHPLPPAMASHSDWSPNIAAAPQIAEVLDFFEQAGRVRIAIKTANPDIPFLKIEVFMFSSFP
jgi:hypothetical protein